jgi:hypothetical protein
VAGEGEEGGSGGEDDVIKDVGGVLVDSGEAGAGNVGGSIGGKVSEGARDGVGGTADGGVAGLNRVERRSSLSTSKSCRSSTSLCRLLVLFVGGGVTSGGAGGAGGVGVGGVGLGRETFPPAEVVTTGEIGQAGSSPAAVAARPRLPAVVAVVEVGTGRLQDTVMTWRPEAWLTITLLNHLPCSFHTAL